MSVRSVAAVGVGVVMLVACGQQGDVGQQPEDDTPAAEGFDDPIEDGGDVEGALPGDAWTALASAPTPRTEVAAASFAGSVWVAGGLEDDGAASADVAAYHPTFDEWEAAPSLPEAVHHAALVADGDGLFLLGGYVGDGFDDPTASVHRLDGATGEWEQGPSLPQPRAAGAAAFDGSRVVYGGGVGPDGLAGDVWALEGGEWRELGQLSQPREHLGAASDGDGRVWLLAGRTGGLDTNLATVDLVEGDEVGEIGELPTARGGLAGFAHPQAGACGVGGEEPDATFAEVECIDADGATQTLPSLSEPRHGLGAAVVDGVAYVVLGGPEPGLHVSGAVEALPLDE